MFCAVIYAYLVVLRKILGTARNHLGLIVYYLTAERIFRANFRGACSPISRSNLESRDDQMDIGGMKYY